MSNDIRCAMVYNAIATAPSGGLYSCCRMLGQKRFWGDPKDYWNSEYIKNHKDLMEKGIWPTECKRCKNEENIGHESKRIRENRNWQNRGYSLDDLQDVSVLSRVDLRLSNVCNLMCIMCEPDSSSLIYNETKTNIDNTMSHYVERYNQYNLDRKNPYTEEEVNSIIEMIEPSTTVYITGGEPSLLKPVYRLLERLIEKGYNKTVDLQFNSNFQSHNSYFIDLISQFDTGLMMPSIDAIGTVAEYCRYPCKWNQIESNIKNYLKRCPKWRTKIFVTTSMLNVYELENIFAWRDHLEKTVVSERDLFSCCVENTLNFPHYFNLKLLPLEERTKIIQNIDNIIQKYKLLKSELNSLNSLKNKLVKWEDNSANIFETFDQLDKIDKIRNTNWRQCLPHLANIEKLKNHNKDM